MRREKWAGSVIYSLLLRIIKCTLFAAPPYSTKEGRHHHHYDYWAELWWLLSFDIRCRRAFILRKQIFSSSSGYLVKVEGNHICTISDEAQDTNLNFQNALHWALKVQALLIFFNYLILKAPVHYWFSMFRGEALLRFLLLKALLRWLLLKAQLRSVEVYTINESAYLNISRELSVFQPNWPNQVVWQPRYAIVEWKC